MPISHTKAVTSPVPDEKLLAQWREGNALSGEVFFQCHFPQVYSFFDTKIDERVDHLVDRTFRDLHVRSKPPGRDIRPVAELAHIALGHLETHLHERLKTCKDELKCSFQQLGSYPSTTISVDGKLQDHLEKAITSLPWKAQIALELVAKEGPNLSLLELGYVMNVSQEKARNLVNDSRNQLDARFQAQDSRTKQEWRNLGRQFKVSGTVLGLTQTSR